MKSNNKGFTLIELLVVIALIGILAGLLFVYINPQKRINDSEDAKRKADLAGVTSQASISFSNNGSSYDFVCQRNEIMDLGDFGPDSENTGKCNDGENFWVVSKQLTGDNRYWCADWLANKKELTSQITDSQTEC